MQFRYASWNVNKEAGSDHAMVVADLEFKGAETLNQRRANPECN